MERISLLAGWLAGGALRAVDEFPVFLNRWKASQAYSCAHMKQADHKRQNVYRRRINLTQSFLSPLRARLGSYHFKGETKYRAPVRFYYHVLFRVQRDLSHVIPCYCKSGEEGGSVALTTMY